MKVIAEIAPLGAMAFWAWEPTHSILGLFAGVGVAALVEVAVTRVRARWDK